MVSLLTHIYALLGLNELKYDANESLNSQSVLTLGVDWMCFLIMERLRCLQILLSLAVLPAMTHLSTWQSFRFCVTINDCLTMWADWTEYTPGNLNGIHLHFVWASLPQSALGTHTIWFVSRLVQFLNPNVFILLLIESKWIVCNDNDHNSDVIITYLISSHQLTWKNTNEENLL